MLETLVDQIPLDRQSDEPIYQQLIRFFQAQIMNGQLQPGTRLPPSRDLARSLGIGRISVVSAYNELQTLGLISAHPGRGTFVTGISEVSRANPAPPRLATRQAINQQNLRELMRLARKPGVIGFDVGTPPVDFLPVEAFRRAIDAVLDKDGAAAIAYEAPEGYLPLRRATRDYLSSQGISCRPENILVTGGAQQAIDLVVQSILTPGDLILTPTPTYVGILDIAQVRQVVPLGVPCDENGVRLDALEDILVEYHPRLMYLNPTFSNPTGQTMPLHRRRQILRLAQQYNMLILEDGVYHELHFEDPAPPSLKALDETGGTVLHASGFSKILLPGTRIGYVIAEREDARERMLRVKQAADICTPTLNQRAMHMFLARGGLPAHLDRVRHILRARRDATVAAAERYLPPRLRWNKPRGGLYLWVELPQDGPTAAEFYLSAIQHRVAFAVGSLFYPNGDGDYTMRINFAAHTPEVIEEGFKRLQKAWASHHVGDSEDQPFL
ncbi:MAG: PLP-dependent aminotransferase family protein [Anaerolineae bacterium]|nr:PLP-dependent aminotransferase family protein [Anaerolineae bacterium]